MTATIHDIGLRARLQRLARRSLVVATILGVCASGIVASPATAETTDDTVDDVHLHLVAGLRGSVAPQSATTATVTIENDADTTLPAGTLSVEINRTAITDDDALTTWLDDQETPGDFDEITVSPTASVAPSSSGTTSIDLPAQAIGTLPTGIYPLRATLSGTTDADTETADAASVLVVSDTLAPTAAVVVPITATPATGTLLTAEELTTLTAADGALTAVLDGVAQSSAVLAIDPAILASIRVLGSTAPAPALDWLARLDGLTNERFALQFGDADATTQAKAGLDSLLQPTTLSSFLVPEGFTAPAPTATPSPTASPDGEVALPNDAALTKVDGAIGAILWPRSDVSDQDLARFTGYLGTGVSTILPSTSIAGSADAHVTAAGSDLLIASASASAALSSAASENDGAARQSLLAAVNAHLQLLGSSTPVLLALTRDETRSADAVRESVLAIDALGLGLSTVRALPATGATLQAPADTTRGASLTQMLSTEAPIADFATILAEPEQLISRQRIRIMRATAVGLGQSSFDTAVDDFAEATQTTLRAVDVPPSSTIQLLSASADLPFSVRNDLAWPVTVNLNVRPSDPRLDVQRTNEVVVQPGTTERVTVPVSARVGSGEVTLGLTLTSPTGVPIGTPETVRVAVRAEWEAIGLALFGGLIVLLLGLGIFRTVRRRRREADVVPEAGSDE